MKIKTILAATAVASIAATSAFAGNMEVPMVDPVVVIPEVATGSSAGSMGSMGGGGVVALIALALVAAAVSGSD